MKKFYLLIIILKICFFTSTLTLAESTKTIIIDKQNIVNLSNCILIYHDSTNSLEIEQIINLSNSFTNPKIKNNEIHMDFSNNTKWLKFSLLNKNAENKNLILEIQNPFVGELTLYSHDNNKLLKYKTTGCSHIFNSRDLNDKDFAYELHLSPLKSYDFYLKIVNNKDALNLPIHLYLPSEYNSKIGNSNIFYGLFYGIIFSILIAIFFFWLSNYKKKKTIYYLWFFIYVILLSLFNLQFDGFAFKFFWPSIPYLNFTTLYTVPLVALFFLSRFSCDFFNLKENFNGLYKAISFLGIFVLLSTLILFVEAIDFQIRILLLYISICALTLTIIYGAVRFRKYVPVLSTYFLSSLICIFFAIIGIFINTYDWGTNRFTVNIIIKLSTMSQLMLLLIAVSSKIKIQQDIIYKNSIKNLEEAKELREKLYSELEQKVKERTTELTIAQNKMLEANEVIHKKNADIEKAFKKSGNHYIKLQKALLLINEQKIILENANLEIQKSTKLKEIFLANTSHEIRTPLNAIVGFTNLLLNTKPSTQQLQYVNNIKTSGENLLVVINDILDFSKIEAGKLTIEKIDFDIYNVFENLLQTFTLKAQEKEIIIEKYIGHNVPQYLIGDPFRLNQILINLIGNAIKFTPKGGDISFGATLSGSDNNNYELCIKVKDSGIGISAENLENIFESFTQAESDTTRKFGGTGLGLSIVKQLVKIQEGRIQAQSKVNVGTEFIIYMSFQLGEKIDSHPKIEKESIDLSSMPLNISLLIVEDNEINWQLAKDTILIWNNNINIDIAENGNIAIQKSYQKKYDLILMDIQMPIVDGYETTVSIRKEQNSLNKETPIIAMTAHTLNQEKEHCLRCGMNDYISKPFKPNELFEKIQYYTTNYNQKKTSNTDDSLNKKNEIVDSTKTSKKDLKQTISTSIISLEQLNKIYDGDNTKIKNILTLYVKNIPSEIDQLVKAVNEQNKKVIKSKSHSLKPKLGYIGLEKGSEFAKTIENYSDAEFDIKNVAFMVNEIKSEWEKAFIEIKKIIEQ